MMPRWLLALVISASLLSLLTLFLILLPLFFV